MDGRNGSSGLTTHTALGRLGMTYMVAASALLLALPAVMPAQSAQPDARWQPWLGCWQPSSQGDLAGLAGADSRAALVCVTPAGGAAAVTISTVVNGKVASSERIEANGQQRPRMREGCNGWQSAEFSPDGRRVYLRSQDSCKDVNRSATGMIAMTGAGQWLDVQGVTTGGRTGVRVVTYRDAGLPATLPAQIGSALKGNGQGTGSEARTASGAPLTTADVIEASRKVDAPVVRAWLLARGQGFALDAGQLVKLADAGVAGEVTDAMVALSYPKTFALVEQAPAGTMQNDTNTGGGYITTGRTVQAYIDPYGYSPFGYSSYGYSPYGYAPYGYSGYGYPYGSGYGFRSGFGGGYGYYNSPIIVLRGSGQDPVQHGQAIKGYGYTRGRDSGPAPSGSGARSGGTYSPSGRGGAARPAPSGGRTAKPRP